MRLLTLLLPLLLAGLCACSHHRARLYRGGDPVVAVSPDNKLIMTAETGPVGRVVKVNLSAQFVVLKFASGGLPLLNQRLQVYRGGLKVGEVNVTGPQMDENVVADLVAGEAAVGDVARHQ